MYNAYLTAVINKSIKGEDDKDNPVPRKKRAIFEHGEAVSEVATLPNSKG